ncbi:MAG TPA: hypothetical protein VJN70_13670 [Gemmatimonadaceae bacterium]|nr:hypothetical protein [Gemmatimonadaceae bacterium]
MESGVDFLRHQIDNAVMQHDAFLRDVVDHESQAQDQRFRDLCARHIPRMQEHQRMLEGLQRLIAAKVSPREETPLENVRGTLKRAAGTALGMARELADVPRQSDYMRLVGDIVMARQAEEMFKTFREGGRQLGIQQLADIGDIGERHHDDYVREANRLVQQMFVEHARGSEYVFSAASAQPHQQGSP